MPHPSRSWTVSEVLAFPRDGNRYELVRGELLVTPAPRLLHQVVVGRLVGLLREYLMPLGLADAVLTSPADITWAQRPEHAAELVQPDVFVVPPGTELRSWLDVGRLVLAAEVVSPSSARGDRVVKRHTYQRHAVETYWVIDPDAALVEVWHPADERPEIVTGRLVWRWSTASRDLEISVPDLVAPPSLARS